MKKILIFVVFSFSCFYVSGQELLQRVPEQAPTQTKNEVPPFRERLFFGGNFCLSLGTYTNIDISPVI